MLLTLYPYIFSAHNFGMEGSIKKLSRIYLKVVIQCYAYLNNDKIHQVVGLRKYCHTYSFTDPDGVQRTSFMAMAVILILLSIAFLVFEVWVRYMMRKRQKYFVDFEVVFRAGVFLLTIIFVFGFWNECWCAPPWQWQIGALAIFMAYMNVLLLLKGMPVLGVPINMLLNIVITFLKLIYLPILLIFSFAIPFYMVFVRDSDAVLVSLI